MHKLYLDAYPENNISYETYRNIFNTEFNISFGYPRIDTCSACDEFVIKAKALIAEGNQDELKRLTILNNLHKKKAQTFYDRKKNARMKSKADIEFQAIAMDYQKNVSLPNITTNDTYYKRQLSMYSFNIHVLSDASSYFFTYPETCGRKGSDEVASFLFYYLTNHLDPRVKHLEIFCDSAGGQNKNYTVTRLIHFLVHVIKIVDSIKITYPFRGHSYLECDKNMGLINLKTQMEVPYQWYDLLKISRQRPKPFEVIEVSKGEIIRKFTDFFQNKYMKKCSFPIQAQREIKSVREHPRFILHRGNYNGSWEKSPILNKRSQPECNESELPGFAYLDYLPISADKHKDLMDLKRFCSAEAQAYFEGIPHT